MMKKKPRRAILKKKTQSLDVIGYDKLDIMWFWQWLKLAVDMEGQSLTFTKKKWLNETTQRKGRYNEKQKLVTIQKRTSDTKTFKIKINEKVLSGINIKELKRLPKIMNMTKSQIFKQFNIWFEKNKHLFGQYAVRYAEHRQDIIESNDYVTVQIPKTLDRRTIDNQIDVLMKGLKLKTSIGKKRDITFIRGVQKDVMQKQWEVFKSKTTTDKSNQRIASDVGYTKKFDSLNVYANKQVVGLRSVQKAFESAKCIIINVANGSFPKSTIE